jgi:translation elongation factor EF-Ts
MKLKVLRGGLFLDQVYIGMTVKIKDVIAQSVAKIGENIKVRRFARFELGTD